MSNHETDNAMFQIDLGDLETALQRPIATSVLTYRCSCGEDFYEDDIACCNCGTSMEKEKLRAEPLPQFSKQGTKENSMKNQYRKKPVVIEAFQMTPERRRNNADWPNWLNCAWQKERDEEGSLSPIRPTVLPNSDLIQIQTLEGPLLVSWGDYIIRGVKGELYPCKEDIFLATYDAVTE